MEPDAGRILADARALAFPRYPGTEGDRRAIDLVAGRLRDAGVDVHLEEFTYDLRRVMAVLRSLLVGCALLVALASVLSHRSPLAALLVLGVGLLAGGVALAWSPWVERLYRGPGPTRTANVVGSRSPEKPRVTLILMAHHDSKSQNLSMLVRITWTLVALLGGLGLLGVLAAGVVRGAVPGPAWLPFALAAPAAVALVVLSTLTSGNESPGGVDNAGSVGVVVEMARILPVALPPDVELIFLVTGAEEDHMVGAMRWLDAHRAALAGRPVWALNFDGAGAPGRVVLMERYGFGKAFSRELSKVAREEAARLGIRVRGIYLPPAMGVDAIPFANRGVDCLTLATGDLSRATIAVHSAGDTADHLDPSALDQVARLTLTICKRTGSDVSLVSV